MSEIKKFENTIEKIIDEMEKDLHVYIDLNCYYFSVLLKRIEHKIIEKSLYQNNIFSAEIYPKIIMELINNKDFGDFRMNDIEFDGQTGKEMFEIIVETYFKNNFLKSYSSQIYQTIENYLKSSEITNLYSYLYNELNKLSKEIPFPNEAAKWIADIRDCKEQINANKYNFVDSVLASMRYLRNYNNINKNESIEKFLNSHDIIYAVNSCSLWLDMIRNHKPYLKADEKTTIKPI